MSFTAITICVASQRVFIVILVYFVIDSVRKLLDTPPTYKANVYKKAEESKDENCEACSKIPFVRPQRKITLFYKSIK
jgi:uncharacterized membrane protein